MWLNKKNVIGQSLLIILPALLMSIEYVMVSRIERWGWKEQWIVEQIYGSLEYRDGEDSYHHRVVRLFLL
jgi:F0F1-type ATP synthase assembly protein I